MSIMKRFIKTEISKDVDFEIIGGVEETSEAGSELQSLDSQIEELSDTDEPEKKSEAEQYVGEWNEIKSCDCLVLRGYAVSGRLRQSRFRSVYWRLFLKLYDSDSSGWIKSVEKHREEYRQLAKELEGTPRDPNDDGENEDDPLSQKQNSRWQRYFSDEELRGLIKQDVIRTFPGVEFFRSDEVQATMVRILFLYARSHPTLSYRQGMHEILAPILFVLHNDHSAFLKASKATELPQDLTKILDPSELAPDAYMIFVRVMKYLESSYYVPPQPSTSHSTSEKESEKSESEVVLRLEWIREQLLRNADPDLAVHLLHLDIPLQLFGIRWLRLLFGREFPLQDLLVLWDAIFSTEELYIVNYVVTAMLVAIRHLLIGQDSTCCLSHLMKYPSGVSVAFVVELALHLAHPTQCPPPPLPPPPKHLQNTRKSLNRLASFRSQKAEKSLRSIPIKSLVVGHSETGSSALDGFTLEDPRLLKNEVENLRAVIALVQLKVSQYHIALHDAVFQSADPEALQAWEGLSELCCLLKSVSIGHVNDVEAADEAGEGKFATSVEAKQASLDTPAEPDDEESSMSNIYRPEMQLIRTTIGTEKLIPGAPMADPLRRTETEISENDWQCFPMDFNRLGLK